MIRNVIACGLSAALAVAPAAAAELYDAGPTGASRSGALAGAYLRLPLGAVPIERSPRAGLRLAFARTVGEQRSHAIRREADIFDLRLIATRPAFYVAGRPVTGADRLNAEGASGGRLDKIMIGAGIALGAVAAFFVVSSVAD